MAPPRRDDGLFDTIVDGAADNASAVDLVERSAEIDLDLEEAFEHRAELTEICRRIVGDTALAEDVVQETYLQAVRNIHKLERRDGLMPWLVTVATRRSLNEIRRRKYSTPVETMPERYTAPETDPCVAVTLTDEFDRVNSIMSTLTTRERDLLMRQVYDGLSLVELAEMEGTSAASVRSVLSRARSKIKGAIAESGARILLPFTVLADKARRRLEPMMARVDRFEIATTAALHPAEVIGAGVLSLSLALGVPTGGILSGDSDATPAGGASNTSSADVGDITGAGGGEVLGRPGDTSKSAGAGAGTSSGSTATTQRGSTGGGQSGSPSGGNQGPGNVQNPLGNPGPNNGNVPQTPEAPHVEPDPPVQHAQDPGETYAEDTEESEDGTVYYLGTMQGDCRVGCSNLFKSDDGGSTWTRLEGEGLSATSLLLPPGTSDPRIFAAGPMGLQVSFDGGQVFEPVVGMTSAGPTAISPRFSTGDPRILVGSAPSPWEWNGTTKSARTWRTNLLPNAHTQHFAFSPASLGATPRLFVGRADVRGNDVVPAVYSCGPGADGDTCERSADLPALQTVPKIVVSSAFATDKTVFAYGQGGVYRSTDGGGRFSPIELPFTAITSITDDGKGTFYASGARNTPAGMTGGVAVSNDGGDTWRVLGAGSPLSGGTRMVTVLDDGRLLAGPVVGSGGGIFCSSDGGTTWGRTCTPRESSVATTGPAPATDTAAGAASSS